VQFRTLGATGLKIAPLVLGGNVFGWTADQATSFAILDAFLERGFNAIDTADVYNRYAPGMQGGESESIIGAWMKDRGVRARIVLITKGGLEMGAGMQGLGPDYLQKACEASLQRLQTDYIDVYLSHKSDPAVPIESTLETYQQLMDAGKIRHAGCSNYSVAELRAALAANGRGLARYTVVEPHYNLIDREGYEREMEGICAGHQVGVIAYYALASGFLTGKYRSKDDIANLPRSRTLANYATPRCFALLEVLDAVARRSQASVAQVALAWLMARPSVTAPIASATSVEQLEDIMQATELTLTAADLKALANASGDAPGGVGS
jgi:aryl-alcohol dehydrogenase-like predicted oxidoreductase